MTRVYCGWCGSASGVNARFCRSCGGEIAAQSGPLAAISPAGRGVPRPPGPTTGQLEVAAAEEAGSASSHPSRAGGEGVNELAVQEEQAVQTLKRLRTSGPLLIEEAMSRGDQVRGLTGEAHDEERTWPEVNGQTSTAVVVTAPAVRATDPAVAMVETDGAWGARGTWSTWEDGVARSVEPDRTAKPDPADRSSGDSVVGSKAEGGTGLPGTPGMSPGQGGPSRVLADASGLQSGVQLSPGVRIALIATIVLVSTIGYLLFRDRLMATASIGDDVRELRSPRELSEDSINIGDRAAALGDLESAAAAYTRARQLTPNNPKALFQLGDIYQRLARVDEALTTYSELLRIAPENLEARLRIARIHQSRDNWTEAHREFQRIIALDQNSPQSSQALEEIENHEAKRAGQEVASRAVRRRSPKLNLPALPAPLIGKREISLQPPGIPVTVSTEVRPPASLSGGQTGERPDPEALVASRRELGLRYLNIQEYRAAIKEFLIVLRLTPEDKDIYYFLASAYNGLQMYPEAHDYYKRVDRGRYVQVAQSGAKRTEKAAADQRRKMYQ